MIQKGGFSYHETAFVSEKAKIGKNTKIWLHVQIREGVQIGENCNLGKNNYIDFDVKIGDNVKLQNNISIWHGVTLENDVFVGPNAVFTNDLYPRAFIWDDSRVETTLIKKGASIGANATIICGDRKIGEYAMVAAGSVVTKDVPDYGLVRGNPARLVGYVCKCGKKLEEVSEKHDHLIMKCSDKKCKFDELYNIKKVK